MENALKYKLKFPLCFYSGEFEVYRHDLEDLLSRLLDVDDKLRIKSKLALQRIAIFKNFNLDLVREKKVVH